ncbi:hypothetical protein GQ53DRAFT_850279 [Thozetella sp. PMI_491]|nr:hypothetical protein GQ53DRAFT_850279 [Thozetella sp. PMI_491]
MNRQSKSRSGCSACKRKRLKCDETVPSCLHCTRRGINCPGYQQLLRWSSKHESSGGPKSADPPEFSQLAFAASESIIRKASANTPRTRRATRELSSSSLVFSPDPSPASAAELPMGQSPLILHSLDDKPHISTSQDTGDGIIVLRDCIEEDETLEFVTSPAQSLFQPSISLVEFWFKSVCGTWAALDSKSNPFRQLCSSLWTSSGPVFYSLQSMAAAWLPLDSPSIKEIAASAPQMSTRALIRDLDELFREPNAVSKLPAGLLVSLFCMSSSVGWIDSRQLGVQYLRNARAVLDLLDMRARYLSNEDRELLEFFRGCLIYEEMLRSIVSNDDDDFRALLEWKVTPPAKSKEYCLHEWSGVPPSVISLFGKVMTLCRRSRKLWRQSAHATYNVMYQAMLHIQEGKELEEALLSVDIAKLPGLSSVETLSEEGEVRIHLYKATEAFRLSSLIQLYQTFPDLVSQRLPNQVAGEGSVPEDRWLIPLTLHLLEILKSIPPTSGMRCLQPLLCISAGSALRRESARLDDLDSEPPLWDEAWDVCALYKAVDVSGSLPSAGSSSGQIEEAREFVRQRLARLEQSLPPKPIAVAKQLLEEIWLTYDKEVPPERSHWLDIMTSGRFESVFG